MIAEKIKVVVETNKNVKFHSSLSSSLTIKEILPILLHKYREVIHDHMHSGQYNTQQLNADRINQISKNGGLLPLSEYVSDILNDNDQLFISLSKSSEKKEEKLPEERISKK